MMQISDFIEDDGEIESLERQAKEVQTERERISSLLPTISERYANEDTLEGHSIREKFLTDYNRCSIEFLQLNNEIVKKYYTKEALYITDEINALEKYFGKVLQHHRQAISTEQIDDLNKVIEMLFGGGEIFKLILQKIHYLKQSIIKNYSDSKGVMQ